MESVYITFHCGRNEIKYRFGGYGMRLSHIFEMPSIFKQKTQYFDWKFRISIEELGISNQNFLKYQVFFILNLKYLVFREKYLVIRKRCEALNFLLEILRISKIHRIPYGTVREKKNIQKKPMILALMKQMHVQV